MSSVTKEGEARLTTGTGMWQSEKSNNHINDLVTTLQQLPSDLIQKAQCAAEKQSEDSLCDIPSE